MALPIIVSKLGAGLLFPLLLVVLLLIFYSLEAMLPMVVALGISSIIAEFLRVLL